MFNLATVLTAIGSVVTSAVTWLEAYAESIAGNDIMLLLVVAVPLVGLGVGLLKRMISL